MARSWGDANVRAGDEILLTEMEHHSNLVPWQQLAERTGAVVRHIPLTDDGRLRLDALDRLLDRADEAGGRRRPSRTCWARSTRWPRSSAGRTPPGRVVLVDAAQSVPHLTTDVQALDCDFLAFSGHKMLGPSGVGVLYGKRRAAGGDAAVPGRRQHDPRACTLDGFEPADLPGKFEAGTPPIVPAIGLGAAIDYLNARRPGGHPRARAPADARGPTRCSAERRRACGSSGPRPSTRRASSASRSSGIHAHDVAQLLDRHGIAVRAGHHCAMPLHKRFGRDGHRPGELLLLQHARGGRALGRRPGAGQAGLPPPAKLRPHTAPADCTMAATTPQ